VINSPVQFFSWPIQNEERNPYRRRSIPAGASRDIPALGFSIEAGLEGRNGSTCLVKHFEGPKNAPWIVDIDGLRRCRVYASQFVNEDGQTFRLRPIRESMSDLGISGGDLVELEEQRM
jgi:hypothetical protein